MPKKKANNAKTLSSQWCPPADVLADGVGEPLACVASTFEFDAAFFETELLPRFLGLKFDQTENELTFLVEREEMLAQTPAAVLVDIHKADPGQTTLRWDQVPIAVPGPQSIQHSKIALLAWERLVRLIVGSANLTRPGYRRNREVFAALDFYDDEDSAPRRPVKDAIGLLEQMLTWSRVPVPTRERTLETLGLVREKLAGWLATPEDFRPREKPSVSFIATHPAIGNQPARSAIDQVLSEWGQGSVSHVTVFTPFVGEPSGAEDKVVRRLVSIARTRDCIGWLIVPRRPAEETGPVVRVPLPESFGKSWQQAFATRGGGRVLALPKLVKGVDRINRDLHCKLLSLEDGGHQLLMVGSSNFTPHGMGIGVFNVEANLLFESVGEDAWECIELPLSWDDWKAVGDVQWDQHYEPAEDTINHAAMLPRFIVCASYSQMTGVLKVILDRSSPEPSEWSIRLKGIDTDDLTLFSQSTVADSSELTFTFPEGSRTAILTALLVEWRGSEQEQRKARLIVSIESKADLAPSDHFKAFGVDAMIDCLIHGRSLAEWQERQSNRKTPGAGMNSALDSLRSVDTSGYMLYQVRRFGRALSGLCERLERVALLPTAVRYRLFKDPLGPVSLAEALTTKQGHDGGSFAALADEQRLFLLAELLLATAHTTSRMVRKADKKTRPWLKDLVREAAGSLAMQVSSQRHRLEANLPAKMGDYVSEVLKETTSLTGQFPAEVAHAG